MEKITYRLEKFEGPMDLLLHLITKHKLDIYDIPIVELVDQYTSYVRQMQDNDMDVASEFLETAARLVYIKTVSLLPKNEEADELKKELTGELIEYRDCKKAADELMNMANGFDFYPTPADVFEKDYTYNLLHETDELKDAYESAVGKGKRKLPPPVTAFTAYVSHKIVSVSSKIVFLLRSLVKSEKYTYNGLFEQSESKSDMVATFLALLELLKAKRVKTVEDKGKTYIELIR